MGSKPTTVEEYLEGFPDDVRTILGEVAAAIRRALPDAEERIRYGMPAFMFAGQRHGIHFAGWKEHVGLYPVGRLEEDLESEITPFRSGKDTVRFVYRDGVPYDLIERLVAARAAQHRHEA